MRISDWSSDVCSSDLSGGKLVECRLFRVVVSHGKVGSDALCILLNFLWADKAMVRHEPQRINASGNAHKRERGDFVHRSEEHTYELQSLMRISYAVLRLYNIIKQLIYRSLLTL